LHFPKGLYVQRPLDTCAKCPSAYRNRCVFSVFLKLSALSDRSRRSSGSHGRRNRRVWGDNVPHFWDQRGTGEYRGRSNENDFCLYSRQSLFSTVQANFNTFNRPLLNACAPATPTFGNTQHYFKTYPARCQWPKIGTGAIQSMAYCC